MTVEEAASKGIDKICLPEWNDRVYLKLTLMADGKYSPWGKLFDPYVSDSHTVVPLIVMGDQWQEFSERV